jgi:hypothetical protein
LIGRILDDGVLLKADGAANAVGELITAENLGVIVRADTLNPTTPAMRISTRQAILAWEKRLCLIYVDLRVGSRRVVAV